MKRMRRIGSLLSVIGILFWIAAGMAGSVSAANDAASLTLLCRTTEGEILSGMQWHIYSVGGRDDDGLLELQNDFAEFPVSLEDTSASGLLTAAQTLENLAVLNKLSPLDSQSADASGTLLFDRLQVGLYLVTGETLLLDDTYYLPTAFLVEITSDDALVDFTAHPKYTTVDADREIWEYTVKKVWSGSDEQSQQRENSVTVQIYRNGVLVNTVVLDESNDWSFHWTADEFYDWRVLEIKVSAKYYVIYRSNETQYVIVNTFNNDYQTDVTQTTDSVTHTTTAVTLTTESGTDITTAPSGGSGQETSIGTQTVPSVTTSQTTVHVSGGSEEKLPQTGQLWWPVPVLGTVGLLLVAIGLRLRSKE